MAEAHPFPSSAHARRVASLCIAAVLAVAGCDCNADHNGSGSGAGGGGGAGAGGGGGDGAGGGGGGGSGAGGGGGALADGGGHGTLEACDGIDNDLNGKIDDVDVGGDGICDCLNVGLIGAKGIWNAGSAFDQWLSERGSLVIDLGGDELTDESLERFDVLIVNDVTNDPGQDEERGIGRDYAPSEIEAFTRFVRNGGGVITMTGYWEPENLGNIDALLEPFGMRYADDPYLSASGTEAVTGWDTGHPLGMAIMSVGVDNGHQPQGAGAVVATVSDDDSRIVGLAQSGTAGVGDGKVFVWADEWITYDALWNDAPEYQIRQLWVNTMAWLTPAKSCEIDVIIVPI
jgi:hypothetical protein